MSKKDEPEWEIVDALPGERKKAARKAAEAQKHPSRFPMKLWIGIAIGAAIVIAFPPAMRMAMNLFRNLVAYWWLLLALAAYWVVRKRIGKR